MNKSRGTAFVPRNRHGFCAHCNTNVYICNTKEEDCCIRCREIICHDCGAWNLENLTPCKKDSFNKCCGTDCNKKILVKKDESGMKLMDRTCKWCYQFTCEDCRLNNNCRDLRCNNCYTRPEVGSTTTSNKKKWAKCSHCENMTCSDCSNEIEDRKYVLCEMCFRDYSEGDFS